MHNARVYIPLSSLFLAPILSLASFLPFLFLISLAPTFLGLISRPFPVFFLLQYVPLLLPFPFLFLISVCKKVLNWGLGPLEDQTAEMVLILHKGPHFPQLWDILGLEIVFLYHKWRNIEISTSILLYMHLVGDSIYYICTIMNIYELLSRNVWCCKHAFLYDLLAFWWK